MFQLIFKGECVAGTDLVTARSSARQLFKANDTQLDRMFSGKPVVIRNQLDQAQAEKYRALLQKHGMRAYVQAMAQGQTGAQTQPEQAIPAPPSAAASQSAVSSQPPQRQASSPFAVNQTNAGGLPIAGERTDAVLAGSALTLDPPGVTLVESVPVEVPSFDHLGAWSLAPAGSDIGSKEELPPPIVPDTSHLTVEPLPSSDDNQR
ncbi:hypothetical protein [Marinobacter sp. LV10MA510-1]|uniref:hypothetical protein n=1 Tax=Marinobacter sp. LV10MA510-1 TaxID=1415567 RepID=UPI000BF3987E|nr:hypothetical protein [Marinobacter sp. LV10MA510-1]PFG10070.1 hypothetical protein ATI45_2481 [Marinobacter sp. LV10MA510-1]